VQPEPLIPVLQTQPVYRRRAQRSALRRPGEHRRLSLGAEKRRSAPMKRKGTGYRRNLTVTSLEQVLVPWSHTIYVKLARPVTPVESV
jgi:hypothetical protein